MWSSARSFRRAGLLLAVFVFVSALSCGGGVRPEEAELGTGGEFTIHVSVGGPLANVTIKVIAIDAVTGLPIVGREGGSELGTAGPTDAAGVAVATLSTNVSWDGPVQLVVEGTGASYVDPSSPPGSAATRVFLPQDLRLTSYIPRYRTGTKVSAPVTLWTSLADAAALAYAQGRNHASPAPVPFERALPLIDDLFAGHLSRPLDWDLRSSVPLPVGDEVGTLRDVVYAALSDLAINQLARDLSEKNAVQPGAVITGYSLLELLRQDIADGEFDGLEEARPLSAGGVPGYALRADTTRFDSAQALDSFVDSEANGTGLDRKALLDFSIFDNISGDTSILYPPDVAPQPFDNRPPSVSFEITFPASDGSTVTPAVPQGAVVARSITVVANAEDLSGVVSVSVKLADGRFLVTGAGINRDPLRGDLRHARGGDGELALVATAKDAAGNTATVPLRLVIDNTAPTLEVLQPVGGAYYSQQIPVDARMEDANPAELKLVEPAGFVDTKQQVTELGGGVSLEGTAGWALRRSRARV